MAIQFGCENCRQPIEVDDEAANLRAECPYCKAVVQVPAFSDPAVATNPVSVQSTPTLQTALPVPHRQGAPATGWSTTHAGPAEVSENPAVLGKMALATIIIAGVLFVAWNAVVLVNLSQYLPGPGEMPDVERFNQEVMKLVESKPWIQIAATFSQILGITAMGLSIASLVRRERPRWPAFSVLGLVGLFVCLIVFAFIMVAAMM